MNKTNMTFTIDELVALQVRSRLDLKRKISSYVNDFLKTLIQIDNGDEEEQELIRLKQEKEKQQTELQQEITMINIKLQAAEESIKRKKAEQSQHKKDMLKALKRHQGMEYDSI